MEEFDLDIFTRMKERTLDDFRPRLRYLETVGVRIPYLSPADLIYLKAHSGKKTSSMWRRCGKYWLANPEPLT